MVLCRSKCLSVCVFGLDGRISATPINNSHAHSLVFYLAILLSLQMRSRQQTEHKSNMLPSKLVNMPGILIHQPGLTSWLPLNFSQHKCLSGFQHSIRSNSRINNSLHVLGGQNSGLEVALDSRFQSVGYLSESSLYRAIRYSASSLLFTCLALHLLLSSQRSQTDQLQTGAMAYDEKNYFHIILCKFILSR